MKRTPQLASKISFIFLSLIFISANAQKVYNRTVVLTSQKQVDAFADVTAVNGSLIISGHRIVNIALPNLQSVTGSIEIGRNPALQSVGFSKLQLIGDATKGGSLIIENNSSLTDIYFPSLTHIYGALKIINNDKLEALNSFFALQSAGAFYLEENDRLRRGEIFRSFTAITGTPKAHRSEHGVLSIRRNSALINVSFLSRLERLTGVDAASILIQGNKSLTNVDGLRALTNFAGKQQYIAIDNNAILRNIDGLARILPVDNKTWVTITKNPKLNRCCGVYNLIAQLPSRSIFISHNGSNCTTPVIKQKGLCPSQENCVFPAVTSQRDVDNFSQTHGCSLVLGLGISGNDITNLDGLSEITTVAWGISINNNPMLTDIRGLSGITIMEPGPDIRMANGVVIQNNDALVNLEGIKLPVIYGGLIISGNDKLKNLRGMSSVNSVFGTVSIEDNSALRNLDGLSSLTFVAGFNSLYKFTIKNNSSLENVNGLSSLESLSAYQFALEIVNNDNLKNLDGLSSLNTLDGSMGKTVLQISDNERLQNINGLSSLEFPHAGLTDLIITDNSALGMCCSLADLLRNNPPPRIDIRGNASTCTFEEITRDGGSCFPSTATSTVTSISVYPNPTAGSVEVTLPDDDNNRYRFVVRDHTGSIILQSNSENYSDTKAILDLSSHPDGLYTLFVYRNQVTMEARRLIIRH